MHQGREVAAGNRIRAGVAGALCAAMVLQASAAAPGAPLGRAAAPGQIQGEARVLHALNRLTFGPRPGEVAAVQTMGLNRWFEQQLDPQSLDDSRLEARLAAYPAMQLSQDELMERFPGPAVIRAMAKGGFPLPKDPVERAIYADQIAFYTMKKGAGKKQGGAAGAAQTTSAPDGEKTAAEVEPPSSVVPVEHLEAQYPAGETLRVLGLDPDARMRAVLAMKPEDVVGFRRSLSRRELVELVAGMTPEQRETLQMLGGSVRVIAGETTQARLMRDVYSDRQLEAVMTDFWLNHFNVYLKKSQLEPSLIPAFERDVIRPRALGKFEDLLVATAKSPAMLVYLDNWRSVGPDSAVGQRGPGRPGNTLQAKAPAGLNENYARELMELHTLGVGGGYTQADVTQVAQVFSGWTIERPYRGAGYTFDPRRHEPGTKVVLGKTIQPGGEAEGLQVLHLLATSPATAQFISTKLAVRFVSDTPPPMLVDRMSKAFMASGGDMKVVLRTMFGAPEFWAPEVERAKVKTPLEFVVSAVRASDADVVNPQGLVQVLDRLGMPLYGMPTPNGFSWKQDGWVSTGALVSRMNFALVLSGNRMAGVRIDWTRLLEVGGAVHAVAVSGQEATGGEAREHRLESLLLQGRASARTRATVLAEADAEKAKLRERNEIGKNVDVAVDDPPRERKSVGGEDGDPEVAVMAGLLLGSPEFQRR